MCHLSYLLRWREEGRPLTIVTEVPVTRSYIDARRKKTVSDN